MFSGHGEGSEGNAKPIQPLPLRPALVGHTGHRVRDGGDQVTDRREAGQMDYAGADHDDRGRDDEQDAQAAESRKDTAEPLSVMDALHVLPGFFLSRRQMAAMRLRMGL